MLADAALNYITRVDVNEEVFVLRAQDALAPQVIRAWARALQGQIASKCEVPDETHTDYEFAINYNKKIDAQTAKAQEALDCADRMEQWTNRKIPD